jgi:hypothetical protein
MMHPFFFTMPKKRYSTKGTFRLQNFNTKTCIFENEVAGGRKYCKNEGLCNSLIINNKTF